MNAIKPAGKPIGLIITLAAELAVALLFGLFSWSMTKSLAQGRTPSLEDTLLLALPAVAVLVCGLFALRVWRKGNNSGAWGLALLPFPLAILVFIVLGAL